MSEKMFHLPGSNPANYLGGYCYPTFSSGTTRWKRKIVAYRERIVHNTTYGGVYTLQEVQVWETFGYSWVLTRDIEFISNYLEHRS